MLQDNLQNSIKYDLILFLFKSQVMQYKIIRMCSETSNFTLINNTGVFFHFHFILN